MDIDNEVSFPVISLTINLLRLYTVFGVCEDNVCVKIMFDQFTHTHTHTHTPPNAIILIF